VLPPNVPYAAPLYEMAFMIDSFLRDAHAREPVTITFVTCEASYIEAFGPLLNDLILERFEARGIVHHASTTVTTIEAGVANFANREPLPYDLLITFPPTGAAVPFPALPTNARGYLDTQLATRHVQGFTDIFAAGDASDFPIKQAFLALLQADAVAEGIAADIQGRLPRFVFEPVSKFVMEEFDTGLYAQAPFATEGGLHVEVDSPAYKAGASPLWRIGKRMLGTAVPRRFSHGEPFNAGLPSVGLDMSVKVLASMAADHRREAAPTP
jgi:sulfide:quinone oxidoreductase